MNQPNPSALERAATLFNCVFPEAPVPGAVVAPGRVNLIGEHTDYNGGFVFPIAIDRTVAVAYAPRTDRRMSVYSAEYDELCEFSLDGKPRDGAEWSRYVIGVATAFDRVHRCRRGVDMVVESDLIVGGGLSSSAALEMAVLRVLSAAGGVPWDPVAKARLAQLAENEDVGTESGIMDQMAVGLGREGHGLLLDCRSLETRHVPIPPAVRVVVLDTGVRRRLDATSYNRRRAQCDDAVVEFRAHDPVVWSLRDIDPDRLMRVRAALDPMVFRRASHVVTENLRVGDFVRALETGDLARAGHLMNASHASLRDLFEVSSPELDLITGLARTRRGCLGARMTGAGFGGCGVALVLADAVEGFPEAVAWAYRDRANRPGDAFVVRPAGPVALVETPHISM